MNIDINQIVIANEVPETGNKKLLSSMSRRLDILQLQAERALANNFAALREEAVYQELILELPTLIALLIEFGEQEEELKEKFKQLCRERELRNQGGMLSWLVLPEGECNQWYWQIAQELFQPKDMTEMLSIVMPSVKFHLDVDVSMANFDPKLKPSKQSLSCSITKKPISLAEPVADSPKALAGYMVVEGALLDVEQLSRFNFDLHMQFADSIQHAYPAVAKQLYGWNYDFKKLAENIATVKNKGMTPREAISLFSQRLALSGSRYTGKEEASKLGHYAYVEFYLYINALPEELKKAVLAIRGQKSIQNVLRHLAEGGCVTQASDYLNAILVHVNNDKILDLLPVMKESELNIIKKRYKKPISAIRDNISCLVPENIANQVYGKVKLVGVDDYLNWLITLPEDMYALFLGAASHGADGKTLPRELALLLEGDLLTASQKKAFSAAMMQHHKKFDLKAMIHSMARPLRVGLGTLYVYDERQQQKNDEHQRLLEILKDIPKSERLSILLSEDGNGNTLLYKSFCSLVTKKRFSDTLLDNLLMVTGVALVTLFVVSAAMAVLFSLVVLPVSVHILAVAIEVILAGGVGFSGITLELVRDFPTKEVLLSDSTLLKSVLETLPAEDRLKALDAKNADGKSVRDVVEKDFSAKQKMEIAEVLPEKKVAKPHAFYSLFGVGRDKKAKQSDEKQDSARKPSVPASVVARNLVVAPAAGMLRR